MLTKTCTVSGKDFVITDEDLVFYEKIGVATPTLCPEERQRRRTGYRNFSNLYKRKCDATEKNIISMYHVDQPFPVYENNYWWGDGWAATDYAQELDFDVSFFTQYQKLASLVPRFATMNLQCENSQYSNIAVKASNCYLVFGCVRNQDCLYGHIVWDSSDCVDNLYIFRCQWSSACIDCVDCYNVHFSTEAVGCSDSYFLHNCRSCKHCFGSTNLRQKEYYFMNEFLGKEKYEAKMKEILPLRPETIRMGEDWLEREKVAHTIFPEAFNNKSENVTGNHIYESRDCQQAFDTKRGDSSKFLFTSYKQENSYDISFTAVRTRFCYESLNIGDCDDCAFCNNCFSCHQVSYSEFCHNCRNCFGCNALRNKEYCIFNKQYEKEAYFELRDRLVEHMKNLGEWGEFFPINHSPFAYNESVAQEYQPLDRAACWEWKEEAVTTTYDGPIFDIPDNIEVIDESICEKILTCEKTGKNYRIVKPELRFYQDMKLPIPRCCPAERHRQRLSKRNPRALFSRKCDKCNKAIETTFAPDRPEKVYCENCFNNAVN